MMEWITIFFIAVGLAMDAFAVSIATSSVYREMHVRHTLRLALFFGFFQAAMPLLGYLAGQGLKEAIQVYDHWIAFGLLGFIGGKMIWEAFKIQEAHEDARAHDPSSIVVVLGLSIATSIDALAVGITLTLITSNVLGAAVAIGVITFIISLYGCCIGKRLGHFFETRIEFFGGLVLIAIGLKILLEHLITGK